MRVRHAVNGDTFQPGELLVAPGGLQTMVCRAGTGLKLAIKDGPAVFHQKPSLEVLFSSLADTAARNTVAAVLSGAGVDGVTSMLSLRRAGARTLAESPQSSACGELPNRAVQCGAAEFTAPANQIAEKMLSLASAGSLSRAA
jgi:two-component system chemotaxis response regulator CheB